MLHMDPVLLPEGPLVGHVLRRQHSRFVPPRTCRLTLRRPGLRGYFHGNMVAAWLDVSEGGVRVVLSERLGVGEILRGRLEYLPLGDRFEFGATVRNVRPSSLRGAYTTGFAFVKPSAVLQACIREALSETPAPTRTRRYYIRSLNR